MSRRYGAAPCRRLRFRAHARVQATPAPTATLWVLRTDVAGARYSEVEDVDLQQTVSKFTARWVAAEELGVRPSLVTLRLVKCGEGKPEDDSPVIKMLDDPSLSLAKSGVTGTAWLRAYVAKPAASAAAGVLHVLPAPCRRPMTPAQLQLSALSVLKICCRWASIAM